MERHDLVNIGSGPGGMSAACRAGARGASHLLLEPDRLYVEVPEGRVVGLDLQTGVAQEGWLATNWRGGPLWPVRLTEWGVQVGLFALNRILPPLCGLLLAGATLAFARALGELIT